MSKVLDLTTTIKEADGTTAYVFGYTAEQVTKDGVTTTQRVVVNQTFIQLFTSILRRFRSETDDEATAIATLATKIVAATATTSYSDAQIVLLTAAIKSQADLIRAQFLAIVNAATEVAES